MARWEELEREAPELAGAVRARFEAHKHHTMGTLRRDGSPRLSGTEVNFAHGELWLGSMGGSRKARDLQRDARVCLHSATIDVDMKGGDAKLSGRAVEIADPVEIERFTGGQAPPGPAHYFTVDLTEASLVGLGDPMDHLEIQVWRPGKGVERIERR